MRLLLTKYFEQAGDIGDRLVNDTLLSTVPHPHIFCDTLNRAYICIGAEKYMLNLSLLLVDVFYFLGA